MSREIALILLCLQCANCITFRDGPEAKTSQSFRELSASGFEHLSAWDKKNPAMSLLAAKRVPLGEPVQQIKPEHSSLGKTTTMRKWMENGECFNLALVPQYNNQHSIFGIVDTMRESNVLTKLTGISACSGGTLPGAFIASGKDYKTFNQYFPKNGWRGFGPAEPKIEKDYRAFLESGLPHTFEELKTPLALALTKWDDLKDLKSMAKEHAHPMTVTKGDLHDAMVAAVATGNNAIFSDPGCPKCAYGFHPKKVAGEYPVTDGAYGDIWGTYGLTDLPRCSRLIHVLPLDYVGQVEPQVPGEIPTHPAEVLTLIIVQPPVASHSYTLEAMHRYDITFRSTKQWNDQMFAATHKATNEALDAPLTFKQQADGSAQAVVTLGTELSDHETFMEKTFDTVTSAMRDGFWKNYGAEEKDKEKAATAKK